MPKNKGKIPKVKAKPKDRKIAKHVPFKSSEDQRIKWSFSRFDQYNWFDNQYKLIPFTKIAAHLQSYESMTWRQIRANSDRDHPIEPDAIILKAQKKLRTQTSYDFDELWRFRFTGAQRLWGMKVGAMFYVLWWDPQHKIYPSKLRHT